VPPRGWAFLLAIVFAVSVADSLLRMPIQPTDSVELMLEAQRSPSVIESFRNSVSSPGFVRPVFRAQNKLLYDLGGVLSFQWVFRGFHALLMVSALVLFAAAARVRTGQDVAAFAMALVVVIGMHTFRGTVQEAYPVNHYLNVMVVCLLTLVLARSNGGAWADVLGVASFVYAVLLLETGVLVWVVAVTAAAVGWRGLSVRALAVMSALLVGYFYLRFAYLAAGVPGLDERSTAVGFDVLESPDLQRRFGAHPSWLHAYNVATSALSVLLSEPRAGRFVALAAWLKGEMLPRMVLALVTSWVATLAIVVTAVRRLRSRALDDDARCIVLAAVVLAGNAALSFAYTKDEILVPAGVFYALAAYAGWREMLAIAARARPVAAVALTVLLMIVTAGWTVRAAGLHFVMRSQAFKHRNDWAELPGDLRRRGAWPTDPEASALVLRLRDDALATPVPNPRFEPSWINRMWEE
jgi:hypothetical protein